MKHSQTLYVQDFGVITLKELNGSHIGKRVSIELPDLTRVGGIVQGINYNAKGETQLTLTHARHERTIISRQDLRVVTEHGS